MRILNLRFKNINSLEGEHVINFEQSPFSESGVFAITGPNGSGKTSVMDAITLGLYGETFRFVHPAHHVMTQQTVDCFSQVEFALSEERYQSIWQVQRADDQLGGELLEPQMRLIRLHDGEVLASTSAQVCASIAELTGMNFRNFSRSILLAQGDFAAFLNALDSERMDILEKIIATDIYGDYQQSLQTKLDQAQAALEQQQQVLQALVCLTPAQLDAYQHDLSDHQELHHELQHEQTMLQQQWEALHQREVHETHIAEQQNRLAELLNQVKSTEAVLAQLAIAQAALPFSDALNTLDEQAQQIKHAKHQLSILQDELSLLQHQLKTSTLASEAFANKDFDQQRQRIDTLKTQLNEHRFNRQAEADLLQSLAIQQTEKKSALEAVDTWLAEHQGDATLLERFPETAKLKKIRAELAELTEQQKTSEKALKKRVASIRQAANAVDKAQLKITDTQTELVSAEQELKQLLQGYEPEALASLIDEQQTRVSEFKALYDLGLEHRKLAEKGFGFWAFFKGKEAPLPELDSLTLELSHLSLEIGREENIKRALQESVSREALLKKMAADRVHLDAGQACPLCGALQHPFVKSPPPVTDSQRALHDQNAKLKTLHNAAERLKQQINGSEKNTEKNAQRQTQLQAIRSRWLSLSNRLNTASIDLDINNLKLMRNLLDTETSELKNLVELASKYKSKQSAIVKLKQLTEKYQHDLVQWQLKAEQLNNDAEARNQNQDDLDNELLAYKEQEAELAAKVTEQLLQLGEKMPAKGKEDAFFDRLNARRQDYHSYVYRRKSLLDELASLLAKQQSCELEIRRYDEQLDGQIESLSTEEQIGLHLALVEKQKLIANQARSLVEQETTWQQHQHRLLQNLQETAFTDLDTLKTALMLLPQQHEQERQHTALKEEISAIEAALADEQRRLAADFVAANHTLTIDEVAVTLKTITERMTIANMEVQRLAHLLDQQQGIQQQQANAVAELARLDAQLKPLAAEWADISAEHGIAFRRRVQMRLIEQLLSQTNAILEKISGRYYLRQALTEQGLALEIEDTYQNNVRRLPKTLSGGESFVVSLALALGLSELANNGKSVDSLFLDEGFGNLDADTLYTVISTLESLPIHGKTVGVISHVEAVQKRIKAQLQVVKKSNGFSELRKAS